MSLKQEIETWVQALAHYDNNEFDESIKVFDNIADTSKILFNCGVINATLGEHEKAVECYQRAIALDNYLAVAYFQAGVSNFLLGDFEEALANFNDTLLYLRGNTSIDYEQLGLKFRLFSCEVLFNRGLCYIYLQQMGPGMQDLEFAAKEKVTPDHEVIEEAIRERAEGYTVFSIPVGVVYRPNEAKVKNLKTKDYLGKARLVAASDRSNAFVGFQGSELKKTVAPDGTAKDDRPADAISYAATNLVQKNIASRGRQQSEPPIGRNMFPPTPPPDSDRGSTGGPSMGGPNMNGPNMNGPNMGDPNMGSPNMGGPNVGGPNMVGPNPMMANPGGPINSNSLTQRAASVRSGRPPQLNLEQSGMRTNGRSNDDMPSMERSRIGPSRTASEPRGPRGPPSRQYSNARDREGGKPRLYRETTNSSRQGGSDGGFGPVTEERGNDEVYDMYVGRRPSNIGRNAPRGPPRYVDEEEEYGSDGYDGDPADGVDFEIMAAPGPVRTRGSQRRAASRTRDIRKFRVKVHAQDDTRYIMIGPAIEFGDFEGRIREKFGFRSRLRIQMRDEGDMITMADQDDLDMLIMTAKDIARKENQEMAKMEIWVQER